MRRSRGPLTLVTLIASLAGPWLIGCEPMDPADEIDLVEGDATLAGTYRLKAVHSGKCADVYQGSTASGADIHQWTCSTTALHQQWAFLELADGYYEVKSVKSGMCMEVAGSSTADAANVRQATCQKTANQQWKPVSAGTGIYTLRPRHSGKCLDVAGASSADGANIHQWSCRTVPQQQWRLELTGTPTPISGTVTFQNTGTLSGWDRVYTQKNGTNTEVSSPVYKGTTAIKTTQTYISSDGSNYHSEVVKRYSAGAGQDRYFGHAIYLASDWVFHDQNVTFQQWAPDHNSGPWVLMFVQGNSLRVGGRAFSGIRDLGSIADQRGKWIRVVTRIRLATAGIFEVWVNGIKRLSVTGDFTVSGGSIRWSNGIYCTRWDTEAPQGQRVLSIWHDQLRVATTYGLADPINW